MAIWTRLVLLVVCLAAVAGCGAANDPLEISGVRAGGLDAGGIISTSGPVPRGQFQTYGNSILQNVGSAAVIESVEVISTAPDLLVTGAHINVLSEHPSAEPIGSAAGWPPAGQPDADRLPLTNVTVPRGRGVQFLFGASLDAAVGTTAKIAGFRVRFTQDGHRYNWTLPAPVALTAAADHRS